MSSIFILSTSQISFVEESIFFHWPEKIIGLLTVSKYAETLLIHVYISRDDE